MKRIKYRYNKKDAWLFVRAEQVKDCWEWIGSVTSKRRKDGVHELYGKFKVEQVEYAAHRLIWELTYGPIPKGLLVCHTCDNVICCNPTHLFLGDHQDNSDDMRIKGRHTHGDRHWTRIHPEGLLRGDCHPARRHPENLARGDRHGMRIKAQRRQT